LFPLLLLLLLLLMMMMESIVAVSVSPEADPLLSLSCPLLT
jgi:hypothetical protein